MLNEPAGVQIDTEKAAIRDVIVSKQYTGAVMAAPVPLYFRVGGYRLKDIYAFPGQSVKKGDVLAELDMTGLRKDIQDAQDDVDSLEKSYEHANAQADLDIQIAQARLDETRLNPDAAAADLNAQQVQVQILTLQLKQAKDTQEAELQWRQSLVDDKKAQLDQAVLTSPVDGVVTYMGDIMPGDIAPAFTDILHVTEGGPDALTLEAAMTPNDVPGPNSAATALIGGKEYDIQYIKPTTQELLSGEAANTAKFSFSDPTGLQAGEFALVTVVRQVAEGALTVPVNALYDDVANGSYVYVMEDGNKVMRQVKKGVANDSYVQITDGLSEGDEVFVHQ
ncbi:MAG: hypothetical protein FWF44_08645 [Defluviitaleaceae bacterium]|nr:hypothetical protein [Defluviitaleaceae bacterium]